MLIAEASAIPWLVALDAEVHPAAFRLDADACTLGRSPLCQVVITQGVVSRLHAKIERDGTLCVLSDVGSANGTYVNGDRLLAPRCLCDQDVIGLGTAAALLRFTLVPTQHSAPLV